MCHGRDGGCDTAEIDPKDDEAFFACVLAENVQPGGVILERDPGPKDLDNRFFFQSRPLPGQRANLSAQSRGYASSTLYEVIRPTIILVNTPEIMKYCPIALR